MMGKALSFFLLFFFLFLPIFPTFGETVVEQGIDARSRVAEKQQEIEEAERQIAEYQKQIDSTRKEAKTYEQTVALLQSKINKLNATIRTLRLVIEELQLKAALTATSIRETEDDIHARKTVLAEQIRFLDEADAARGVVTLLLFTERFADFLQRIRDLLILERKTQNSIRVLGSLQEDLKEKKALLDEQREEQAALLDLRHIEQEEVAKKRREQQGVLNEVKQQEKTLKKKVTLSKQLIESLKDDMYALSKVGVPIEDAVKYGELVANRAEIRPAFLIAVLEVESRLGLSIGKGTWKKDMKPDQYDAFLAITKKLDLDPDAMPVSRKPSYGWGGAMGPAQFLPKTWLGYESGVARLTGHNPPSPWNTEDSFMAAGMKLANDGARSKNRAGELRAANQYISGNPACQKQICTYYSNLVLDKAGEIEEKLKAGTRQ